MTKPHALESRWPRVLDITLVPAVAHLPATLPAERRNVAVREALVRRIHSEFVEMPGLSLTLEGEVAWKRVVWLERRNFC